MATPDEPDPDEMLTVKEVRGFAQGEHQDRLRGDRRWPYRLREGRSVIPNTKDGDIVQGAASSRVPLRRNPCRYARDIRDGTWRYRVKLKLPNRKGVRISGTPQINTKVAARDRGEGAYPAHARSRPRPR